MSPPVLEMPWSEYTVAIKFTYYSVRTLAGMAFFVFFVQRFSKEQSTC